MPADKDEAEEGLGNLEHKTQFLQRGLLEGQRCLD